MGTRHLHWFSNTSSSIGGARRGRFKPPDPPPTHPAPLSRSRQLGRVGHRLVPVAVVYARSGAVLTCVFAGGLRASGRSYRNIERCSSGRIKRPYHDASPLASREATGPWRRRLTTALSEPASH